jgi:hypothetical protein
MSLMKKIMNYVNLSLNQIKDALFLIEKNKATGPDKIPIEF